jgi:multicomponent Na+:H+ antiporter subunit A
LPLITAAAVLAGLSMAGLPPLLGFVGKELVLEAGLDATIGGRLPMGAVLVSGALLLAATGRLIVRPFFGHAPECGDTSGHRPGIDLLLGPLLPSLAGLLFGLYPGLLGRKLLAPAAAAVLSRPVEMHLALWHGFNFILFLSAIVILAGCGFYAAFPRLEPTLDRWRRLGAFGPAAGYEVCLKALKRLAAWQTRLLQGGYLHNYILVIVLTAVGLTLLALGRYGALAFSPGPFEVRLFEAVIAALMIAAAVVAVRSESRLGAIVAMGVIGYGLALIFVDFGAPDLAMTQFIIETMTVILFVLVIYRLPPYRHISTRGQKTVNAAVGIVSGLLMATLVLVALDVQQGSRLSHFFAENSLLLAHGRNVVNVIIVDFRGLDTLGEITVLSLAGIGVYTLLKLRPHP